jgi:hypothetical protein
VDLSLKKMTVSILLTEDDTWLAFYNVVIYALFNCTLFVRYFAYFTVLHVLFL